MPAVALATWDQPMPHADRENALVVDALAEAGVDARLAAWDDPAVGWASFDAVVLRTPWDYTERLPEFLAWLARVEAATRVWNPPALVRWNADKRYLLDLASRGVSIPPSVFLPAGSRAELRSLLAERGWLRFVVKATVDAGARRGLRGGPDDLAAGAARLAQILADRGAIVQPYLPSIEREGETSLVYLDGELSHAVRKRPAAGDWRIQPQHGGSSAPVEPEPDERAVAAATLAALDVRPLYARVDLVRTDDGAPALMELEVIEPFLFLESAPGAAARYARAVAARLR